MKTSVNLIRKLDNFQVIQRTKDGMFNATSLLKNWNEVNGSKKKIDHFFENESTKSFIESIIKKEDLHTRNSVYVKSRASRGENSGTWMHPYLFIDFAMWINPSFKYEVIKFVYDELVQDRKLSGNYYVKLSSLVKNFEKHDFSEIGRMLNFVIFNEHKKDRRNLATPKEQNDLQMLERDMCRDIERGYIRTWEDFKSALRKEWAIRNSSTPKIFS